MSLTVARNVGFYSTRMSTASRPQLLAIPDVTAFRRWYEATLTELCLQEERPREPYWSQAFAVGSRAWLSRLADGDPQVVEHIRPLNNTSPTSRASSGVLGCRPSDLPQSTEDGRRTISGKVKWLFWNSPPTT